MRRIEVGVHGHGVRPNTGKGTYRAGWATSSASVREWPGGPAREWERWAMCGKEALNSSRPSGFLEFVLFNKRSATGPEGGGRDARNMEVTCEHEGEGEKARREELACCET